MVENGTSPCFYVYVFFRPWDGSPFYVGKGKRNRWRQVSPKSRNNQRFHRIIAKANRLGLEVPVIKVREGLTNEQACEIEIALIAAVGRGQNGPLVNLTDGGDGKTGYVPSAETCQKIRIANTGHKASLETKALMSAQRKNVPKTPAHNKAVSEALSDRKFSDEHLENMRKAQIKRYSREEEHQKLRDYFANLTDKERAARNQNISKMTIAAMADPAIRAKISESRRAR